MDANELRALAEALLPMAAAPCFDGIDIERAADYLRAQADAQPVAWMYEHDGCVDTPLLTVNRWTKCEEPWNESPLFLHPAPAAPQAEPIDPHMIVADDRFPDAQAEPKRKPLSDERIDAALQTDPAMILALMNGEMTVGEFKAALRRLARTVEHAHGISGGGHD